MVIEEVEKGRRKATAQRSKSREGKFRYCLRQPRGTQRLKSVKIKKLSVMKVSDKHIYIYVYINKCNLIYPIALWFNIIIHCCVLTRVIICCNKPRSKIRILRFSIKLNYTRNINRIKICTKIFSFLYKQNREEKRKRTKPKWTIYFIYTQWWLRANLRNWSWIVIVFHSLTVGSLLSCQPYSLQQHRNFTRNK